MSCRQMFAAAALLLAACPVAHGDESAVAKAVGQLLELGWPQSLQARSAAERQYERCGALDDLRVDYAYALIKIRHRRYSEALALVDALLEDHPAHSAAAEAKVWLATVMRRYDVALVQIDRIAAQFPAEAAVAAQEEQILQSARFLGQVFGYLEGPAQDASTAANVARQKAAVLGRLSESRQIAFQEGWQSVSRRYAEYSAERTEVVRKAKAEAQADMERQLDFVQAEREAIQAQQEKLTAGQEKLRQELKSEREEFAKKQRPLLQQLGQIEVQAAVINRELAILAAEIDRLDARLQGEEDPATRRQLNRRISRLSLLARRYDGDLLALTRRARVLETQRAELAIQQRQSEKDFGGQIQDNEEGLASLAKQRKRADISEQRIRRVRSGATRRSRALSAQARAFTTYVPFPLEREKQRLLDSF